MDQEYIARLMPNIQTFFLYSFHPYKPIRNLCKMIINAVPGKESRILGKKRRDDGYFFDHMSTMTSLLRSAFMCNDEAMIRCGCHCLTYLLTSYCSTSILSFACVILPPFVTIVGWGFNRDNDYIKDLKNVV